MAARFFFVLSLTWAAACQNTRFGQAIGRTPPSPLTPTNTTGVQILEVQPDSGHVQLTPNVDRSDTLDPSIVVFLLKNSELAEVGATTSDQLVQPGFLGGQTGELAVFVQDVDSGAESIESYLAWGADPSANPSPLYLQALTNGVNTPPVSVPMPLPLGAIITPAGCLNCTPPPSPIILTEVHPGNGGDSYVELQNTSAAAVDLSGARVCNDGQCESIAKGMTLAPSALVQVPVSSEIFGDSETVIAEPGVGAVQWPLAYMRTLEASTRYEALAVSRGLWTHASAPLGDYVPGESLSRNPGTDQWFPAAATPGDTNPTIDRAGLWQSCAEPAQPAARPPLPAIVVTRIDHAVGAVTLLNTSAAAVDLTTVQLAGLSAPAPVSGTLASGATATFTTTVDETGALTLSQNGTPIQFAQWGVPSAGVSSAVAADLWPAASCVLPRISTALELRSPILTRGSGAYLTD